MFQLYFLYFDWLQESFQKFWNQSQRWKQVVAATQKSLGAQNVQIFYAVIRKRRKRKKWIKEQTVLHVLDKASSEFPNTKGVIKKELEEESSEEGISKEEVIYFFLLHLIADERLWCQGAARP